jgi:tol-pal system protein YbgF
MQLNFFIKILTIAYFLHISIYANDVDNNDDKIITYGINEELDASEHNKAQYFERELRSLINRVEILEHKLSKFESDGFKESSQSLEEKANAVISNEVTKSNEFSESTLSNPEGYLYDKAIIEFKKNNLVSAQKLFKNFIDKYPNSKLISNSYFWYAETFFKQNMFEIAAVNYLKGYQKSPKGAKAADSLLQGATSLGALKKTKDACGILSKLSTEFPNRAAVSIKRTKELKDKFGCK